MYDVYLAHIKYTYGSCCDDDDNEFKLKGLSEHWNGPENLDWNQLCP